MMTKSTYSKKSNSINRQVGFTLIELMVAITIALFMCAIALSIFLNMKSSSVQQNSFFQLEDNERFALNILTNTIQIAGYNQTGALPNDLTPVKSSIKNDDSGNDISVTYQAFGNSDATANCLGGKSASGTVWQNVFTIKNKQLSCSVFDAAGTSLGSAPLVDNVSKMEVFYGIDSLNRSIPSVNTYVPASEAASSTGFRWENVRTVQIRLTFLNPYALGQGGHTTSNPSIPPITQIVALMSNLSGSP